MRSTTCDRSKNGIFVLLLPEYVQFGGMKLILNSTLTLGRERWVSVMVSIMPAVHSCRGNPRQGESKNVNGNTCRILSCSLGARVWPH